MQRPRLTLQEYIDNACTFRFEARSELRKKPELAELCSKLDQELEKYRMEGKEFVEEAFLKLDFYKKLMEIELFRKTFHQTAEEIEYKSEFPEPELQDFKEETQVEEGVNIVVKPPEPGLKSILKPKKDSKAHEDVKSPQDVKSSEVTESPSAESPIKASRGRRSQSKGHQHHVRFLLTDPKIAFMERTLSKVSNAGWGQFDFFDLKDRFLDRHPELLTLQSVKRGKSISSANLKEQELRKKKLLATKSYFESTVKLAASLWYDTLNPKKKMNKEEFSSIVFRFLSEPNLDINVSPKDSTSDNDNPSQQIESKLESKLPDNDGSYLKNRHYLRGLTQKHLNKLFEIYACENHALNKPEAAFKMDITHFCHAFLYFNRSNFAGDVCHNSLADMIDSLHKVMVKPNAREFNPVPLLRDHFQLMPRPKLKELERKMKGNHPKMILTLSEGRAEQAGTYVKTYGLNLICSIYQPSKKRWSDYPLMFISKNLDGDVVLCDFRVTSHLVGRGGCLYSQFGEQTNLKYVTQMPDWLEKRLIEPTAGRFYYAEPAVRVTLSNLRRNTGLRHLTEKDLSDSPKQPHSTIPGNFIILEEMQEPEVTLKMALGYTLHDYIRNLESIQVQDRNERDLSFKELIKLLKNSDFDMSYIQFHSAIHDLWQMLYTHTMKTHNHDEERIQFLLNVVALFAEIRPESLSALVFPSLNSNEQPFVNYPKAIARLMEIAPEQTKQLLDNYPSSKTAYLKHLEQRSKELKESQIRPEVFIPPVVKLHEDKSASKTVKQQQPKDSKHAASSLRFVSKWTDKTSHPQNQDNKEPKVVVLHGSKKSKSP